MRHPSIWIVSPPNYPYSQAFDEVALALSSAFRALSIDASIVRDASLLGESAVVLGSNLLPYVAVPQSTQLILFNLEQISPNSPWLTPDYISLLRRYPVWDYSSRNIEALATLGIRAMLCEIGYMPELTRIPPAAEDIDVLFVGSPNPRRIAVLREIARRGARVEAKSGIYGNARDALFARSKLIVNIHFYESRVFEVVRVAYLLANRKCVVSEIGSDPAYEARFAPGVAFSPSRQLPDHCLALLSDPTKRHEHERLGFERFSAQSQVDYLRRALNATAALEAS